MRLFHSYHPNDVLYLMPVRMKNEQLPKGKIRMLYCDAEGKVHASLIERSIYDLAKSHARKMERLHKSYAILGLEISSGNPVPLAVEVGTEELWALDHILEHALRKGSLPDVLKKYPKQIIKLSETKRKELVAQHEQRVPRTYSEATPKVLYRLPYYSEDDIEVSVPIYKAEHRYPLIVLKRLSPNEHTSPDMQRLLILDSDGDLAIIRVPLELMDRAEKGLEKWKTTNDQDGYIICSRHQQGFSMSYLAISELQRNALDKITKHFEETGYGKQPVSTPAQAVLAKARDILSSIPR